MKVTQGCKSVGVQRQYSGTAGRIENCQIGVFMALVGSLPCVPRPTGHVAEHVQKGADLIPLTESEIRRLLLAIIWPRLTNIERALAWSNWRRRHQAIARAAHYRRKSNAQL